MHRSGISQPRLWMTQPTQTLRDEHADVRRFLVALQAMGRHVAIGGAFPVADCADAIRYLREFVVAVHFRKEGEVVFPAIAMHGTDHDAEQIGLALRLQDEALSIVHSLVLFWEPSGDLTPAECAGFADAVQSLAALCERMVDLEEREIFAVATMRVPPDDRLDWPTAIAAIHHDRTSRAEWLPLLARLEQRWHA